jgi:LAS superfamily LD-carboxypeptidase LdcB
LQDKTKAKHRYSKSKPQGLYSGKDRQYVYGDNTPRNKGRWVKVLYVLLPIVMVLILALGFFLGYLDYKDNGETGENPVVSNDNYITVEQQKTLYKIVNISNSLDRSFVPEISGYNGINVNKMMKNALANMVNAAKADGVVLKIKYGYVSYDDQHTMYQKYVDALLDTGKYTKVRAESVANRKICDGGNSERQLGLLVEFDCDDKDNFNSTEEFQWLNKHGADYGFMQRYTKSSEQVSAMDNDYTLWRYIGVSNASMARKLGLNFNELIEYLES